jgi:hypothetical protein
METASNPAALIVLQGQDAAAQATGSILGELAGSDIGINLHPAGEFTHLVT